LQVFFDSARQKPTTPAKATEVARMEYEIDVLQLGDAAARAKRDKLSQLRGTSESCSLDSQYRQKLLCCFGFADESRAPLLAETLKKEQIKYRLDGAFVCVLRQEDNERVRGLQNATP
ncbi:MAG: hypothetical protein WCC66_06270, partial [Rhizobiaceae bacterium]